MRTYAFRGKTLENGEWRKGSLVIREQDVHGTPGYFISGFGGAWEQVDPETVGQFTGELSIDGEGVYEGDRLRFPGNEEYLLSVAVYSEDDGAWELQTDGHPFAKIGMVRIMQLCGNIHDEEPAK